MPDSAVHRARSGDGYCAHPLASSSRALRSSARHVAGVVVGTSTAARQVASTSNLGIAPGPTCCPAGARDELVRGALMAASPPTRQSVTTTPVMKRSLG